jgi:hypothetical protein
MAHMAAKNIRKTMVLARQMAQMRRGLEKR